MVFHIPCFIPSCFFTLHSLLIPYFLLISWKFLYHKLFENFFRLIRPCYLLYQTYVNTIINRNSPRKVTAINEKWKALKCWTLARIACTWFCLGECCVNITLSVLTIHSYNATLVISCLQFLITTFCHWAKIEETSQLRSTQSLPCVSPLFL